MSKVSRRSVAILLATASLPLIAAPARQGVIVRFRIERSSVDAVGMTDRRSYENAVLLQFDESFARDFDREFRVALLPRLVSSGVEIDMVVHDIREAPAFAGHATAIVPFAGETTVELAQRGAVRYGAVLRVAKAELPKGAA